jgi:hypothetical protein
MKRFHWRFRQKKLDIIKMCLIPLNAIRSTSHFRWLSSLLQAISDAPFFRLGVFILAVTLLKI